MSIEIVELANCRFEVLTEGEKFIGLGKVWIGQTLVFGAYVRSVANFRTPVGSLEVFIFLATYFYIAAIILLVAMELDELVRADMQRPRNRQKLLPLVASVIRG